MPPAEPCCSFCKLPRSKVKNSRLIPSKTELDKKICIDCVKLVTDYMKESEDADAA